VQKGRNIEEALKDCIEIAIVTIVLKPKQVGLFLRLDF